MDSRLLTEAGWKAANVKFKIKSNELQKALAQYDELEDDEHDDLLECIAEIKKAALALKKSKEAAANASLIKHLTELISAAEVDQRDVTKDKAEAGKKEAANQKPGAVSLTKREVEEEENEEEEEEYGAKLLVAFRKLKGAKDISFQFLVCDAKPTIALMLARRISAKHKEELTRVTDGSKRFPHVGQCRFEDGYYVFDTAKPVPGLARKIQASLKFHIGKKLPIRVGTESAEEEEFGAAVPASAAEAAETGATAEEAKRPRSDLAKAAHLWRGTRGLIEKNISALRKAIQDQCADEDPDFVEEVNNHMARLDRIVAKLDTRLADSFARAHEIQEPGARKAELVKSRAILTEYINYVKAEPLIAHLDANPFGVKSNLKALLAGSLTHMAQAIG